MSPIIEYIKGFGRFQRNARLYLISYALSYVSVGIILVLYNLYLSSLGYGADFIGLVLFMGAVGVGVAIFPAGICVDRFGGKEILIWASVLIGFAGAGQFLLRQPVPLLISAFVAGIGAAFIVVVNAPFLIAYSDPAERSLLFSFNIVVSLAATVLGEMVGGVLPIWFRAQPWAMAPLPGGFNYLLAGQPLARSYQLSLLLAGIIAAPSFIPLFMMSNDRPSMPVEKEPRSSLWSWRRMSAVIQRWRQVDVRAVVMSPLVMMTLFWTLLGMGAGLLLPYFNLYFVQHLGASSAFFGFIDGCSNALNALCTLLAPLLMVRIGRMRTLLLTRLASLPVMLAIGLTSWLPLAAFLYPLRQCLMDMSAGILQVFSMEVIERPRRGVANSSYQAAFQGSQAITTPLGGLLIVHAGYSIVFVITALFYLLALVVLWGRFGRGGQDNKVGVMERVVDRKQA